MANTTINKKIKQIESQEIGGEWEWEDDFTFSHILDQKLEMLRFKLNEVIDKLNAL